MKILMIIDALGKGGKERRMLELIKGLSRHPKDFEIYLISLTDTVEYKNVYELPVKFEILKRKSKKDISIVFQLRKIIRSFHPDIIHSWSTMASVYTVASNFFSRIPFINGVVADAHHKLNLGDKHFLRVKLTAPFSDAIVSNSQAGLAAYRIPKSKSVLIYNGIDFGRFENLTPPEAIENEILGGRKGDSIIVAMLATFDERKDYFTLANAAVKLCATNKQLVFLLIGSGPTLIDIKKIIPPDLLNRQIIFTGRRDNVEAILQIVDIGVMITNTDIHGEGISNSIIEFMSSGKPVIATRGGGSEEVVKDGKNGFLVEPKNHGQIAEKIEVLLRDPALRREMGQHAIELIQEQFDLQQKTEEYINLYNKLTHVKE